MVSLCLVTSLHFLHLLWHFGALNKEGNNDTHHCQKIAKISIKAQIKPNINTSKFQEIILMFTLIKKTLGGQKFQNTQKLGGGTVHCFLYPPYTGRNIDFMKNLFE